MKEITKLMINMYNIEKLKCDFMGYPFDYIHELSYHHMIKAKENGGEEIVENGAILVRNTSHDYLHIIEDHDKEIYNLITEEMIKENKNGRIDIKNLAAINKLLLLFEANHYEDTLKNGKLLIKKMYKNRLLNYCNLE